MKKLFQLWLDEDVREKLKYLAKKDQRTLTSYVRYLLSQKVDKELKGN